jgi:hypothetical protein
MKTIVAARRVLLASLFALLVASAGAQQVPSLDNIKSQEELDKALASLDTAVFDAYNRCDVEKFGTFFADDVEFYHDQGGVTLGKEKLIENLKNNICGGDVRRELVPGTVRVYHMKGYGAVQIGVHRFLHPKSNTPAGEARFIHLWQYKQGAWKITRVISYDHHAAAK